MEWSGLGHGLIIRELRNVPDGYAMRASSFQAEGLIAFTSVVAEATVLIVCLGVDAPSAAFSFMRKTLQGL